MFVVEGDPEKPFFEQNPELRYLPEVRLLVHQHGEDKAGVYMWASYMFEDPRSKIYKVPIDDRTEMILSNYIEPRLIGSFDKEKVIQELAGIREAYPRLALTKSQLLYKTYADKIDEALAYVRSLDFDSSAERIMHIMEKVTKMWPTYEKAAEKMREDDAANSELRGGIKESHREKRGQ